MKTEPRHYILQATSLASKEALWQSCTPVSYLPHAIPFFFTPRRNAQYEGQRGVGQAGSHHSNVQQVERDGCKETAGAKNKWQAQQGDNTGVRAWSKAAAKGLQLQHGAGAGLRPVPTLQTGWVGGMQMSCASAGSTGLVCLTSCRWETVGNVSRSGFESWPVVTINKKLKSFTVCTYSF